VPGARSRGLRHLAIDQGGLGDNARLLHFQVEVVSFTGALAHAGEHGDAAVVHGDVVDHLHHDDGLADAGAAEHAHLAPAGEGNQQVDDLDARLEDVDRRVLLGKQRGQSVNGHPLVRHDGSEPVHGPSDDVDDAPEARLADGNHDRGARVLHRHAAHQAVGDVHGDAAHHVVAQVLGHLDDEVVLGSINGRIRDGEGREDGGKFPFGELHVDNRPDDLYNGSDIHNSLL
jgi:hypothetical protein